jgi:hypothetical protein
MNVRIHEPQDLKGRGSRYTDANHPQKGGLTRYKYDYSTAQRTILSIKSKISLSD